MTEVEIISLWHSLPLSADNDLSALSVQIGKNPEAWEAAGLFLKHTDLSALSLGRHEIGQGCYANVQEYETKTTSKYELHRRYIDVQLLGFGEELVYVAPKDQVKNPLGEFDEKKDIGFYASVRSERKCLVSPESYLLLYPTDAHMPCMAIGKPSPVRKIVVKIPYK